MIIVDGTVHALGQLKKKYFLFLFSRLEDREHERSSSIVVIPPMQVNTSLKGLSNDSLQGLKLV
jgi:hypothetical protein